MFTIQEFKKQAYISSLYEISLNIGSSLDLDELANSAISSYISHIDCIGGMITKNNPNKFEILAIKPKVLKKQTEFLNFIKELLDSENFENYIVVPYPSNQFCYIAKLGDFGHIVLLKSVDFSSEHFLKSLEPLNQKLTNSIISCINSQKLFETERMMFQQTKLASMGEMIGNIAHQWRQPLCAVSVMASTIELNYSLGLLESENLHTSISDIVNQVEYMSKTIDVFRNFFKPSNSKSIFGLKNIFENIYIIITSEIKKHNIELIFNIPSDIKLYAYEQELMQALINIINNAKDALVESKSKHKIIKIDAFKKEGWIEIVIQDSGGGIPDEILHKIFEPYFTTKHQSRGTGIGLFMTSEIITKHSDGKIIASNQTFEQNDILCEGARFVITLKDASG